MKNFLKLTDLADMAEARGFRVQRGATQVELWYPNTTAPTTISYGGSSYSTANIVLSSGPGLGYGYNDAFQGPYHYGYVPANSYGAQQLLSYIEEN